MSSTGSASTQKNSKVKEADDILVCQSILIQAILRLKTVAKLFISHLKRYKRHLVNFLNMAANSDSNPFNIFKRSGIERKCSLNLTRLGYNRIIKSDTSATVTVLKLIQIKIIS